MKIIVMGVSGSGKTTIGKLLATQLAYPFYDADDFHPPENVAKMSNGIPLTDEDRKPWLETLYRDVTQPKDQFVLACSALKKEYRKLLDPDDQCILILLTGPAALIMERMDMRKDHFMPAGLLESQIKTLEAPADAVVVDISNKPDEIVKEIMSHLANQP